MSIFDSIADAVSTAFGNDGGGRMPGRAHFVPDVDEPADDLDLETRSELLDRRVSRLDGGGREA